MNFWYPPPATRLPPPASRLPLRMKRHRTSLVAALLLVPIVAGGFLLQEPPTRANAKLFEQVVSLVSRQYVDTLSNSELLSRAAEGLVKELHDPYTELFTP